MINEIQTVMYKYRVYTPFILRLETVHWKTIQRFITCVQDFQRLMNNGFVVLEIRWDGRLLWMLPDAIHTCMKEGYLRTHYNAQLVSQRCPISCRGQITRAFLSVLISRSQPV